MSRDDDTSESDESAPAAAEPRNRFSWTQSGRPSRGVSEPVAAATGRDPSSLPPLDHYVDATTLDTLLTDGPETPERDVRVSFDYDGVDVTVDSDGGIKVRADGADREPDTAGPRTEAEVQALLRDLFHAAFHNGVSVSGGWTLRNGPESPDWDVHVTRVEKPKDEDGRGDP